MRGGAATVFFPVWHYEYPELVVLKNNKGTEDNRERRLDYCFQFNGLMYERLINGENISLFSPNDVPNLYTAFCNDQDLFRTLYEKYEKDPNIRKRSIPALEIFEMFVEQRVETGRIYLQNIDHTNTHGSFDEEKYPISQSNLCLEITLPSEPLSNIDKDDGMISLCTLAGINWGNINKPEDFEEPCDIAVRALDELLDYQDYPVKSAEKGTKMFRTLGVGVINFAYALAKRGLKYDDSAFEFTNEYMEAMTYYLIKSSVNLAKEKGKCDNSDDTKYGKGILPIDTYKSYIDDLVGKDLKMDWESLRQDLLSYGIRNATVCALMPSECQSLDNELLLKSGEVKTLGELIETHAGIDLEYVHNNIVPGTRYSLHQPIEFANGSTAYEVYWNGIQDVTEIEFEDGSTYKFTNNHMLLVNRDGEQQWVRVDSLKEGDDIVGGV